MKSTSNSEDVQFDTIRVSRIESSGANSNILIQGNLIPTATNEFEIGTTSNQWGNIETVAQTVDNNIRTNLIYPATGNTVYIHGNLLPDGVNTYDFGSSSQPWKDSYTTTTKTNTLSSTGSVVTIDKDFRPSSNNAVGLGSASLQFSNLATTQISGSTSLQLATTSGDIAMDPGGSGKIVVSKAVEPTTNNTLDLGSASNRFRTEYTGTDVNTDRLVSNKIGSSGTDITLEKNILPNANNTISIGSNTLRLNTVHNVRNYIPNDDSGTNFSSTSNVTLLSGGNTIIPLNISSPQYDDTDAYSFKIPQKGYYTLTFSVDYDIGVTPNRVDMWIFNGFVNEAQQYCSFDTNSFTPSLVTFSFWANSLSDRFSIWALSNTVNVTNFRIDWGRLMCASAHI